MENKNLPRDVVLYLLSTITMAISAISLGTILFQIINIYLPDVLNYQPASSFYDAIRYAIASLVVVFPVYVWVMRFLNKDLKISPEKKELKIRKWLLYLTLFASALVIIGDLIALIYNFLQGELTIRFALKILTILLISVAVFVYYRKILRPDEESGKSFAIFILPKIVITVVFASIIAGIIIAGLPQDQRLVRLDEKRISDLSMIDSQIDNYYSNNRKLPNSLLQLETELNINLQTDPVTKTTYEYIKESDLTFQLCAVFQTSSQGTLAENTSIPISQFYTQLQNHAQGRQCFERTINPANYPSKGTLPITKPVPIEPM